jgi:hypothetical protein
MVAKLRCLVGSNKDIEDGGLTHVPRSDPTSGWIIRCLVGLSHVLLDRATCVSLP